MKSRYHWKKLGWALFGLLFSFNLHAQKDFYESYAFTNADTLRGMLRPERTCYDVHFYDLNLTIHPKEQRLEGYVDIFFEAIQDFNRLQIDLYANMKIDRIICRKKTLEFQRIHDAVFIDSPKFRSGEKDSMRIYYHGSPTVAKNAPWDGGFIWTQDDQEQTWVAVSCEGDGASLWWPNKDHLSDEPDSIAINITVPKPLVCIANGNLKNTVEVNENWRRYEWMVTYPINNYNVTLNIGDYVHFGENYQANDGSRMPLDYYVLSYNRAIAEQHFQQVPKVLRCFEEYFGKYPFWNDGFALVETPYLGMEHQGAIAYGNRYQRGYLGGMIPDDMNWDYIIVHETGHEYFGNSISCNDLAEMWIHESFTTYMEALYVECSMGYEAAIRYLATFRNSTYINNQEPILGPMNVNWEDWKGSDHYFKGSWMLHTLRHAIDNDELWFDLLYHFYQRFAISNIRSSDFFDFVNERTGKDFSAFFEQYLVYPNVPTLEYRTTQIGSHLNVEFRWKADVARFDMPIKMGKEGRYLMVRPKTKEWRSIQLRNTKADQFKIATELFLVDLKEL